MGLCVLGIFIIIIVGLAGSREHNVSEELVVSEVATTSEPLSDTVDLPYGELVFEPKSEDHYTVSSLTVASDLRPFTDKALLLSLSALSGVGTKDSDFTNSRLVFDRKTGDIVLTSGNGEGGSSSIATIYERTDNENLGNDLRRISIGTKFSFETPEDFKSRSAVVESYCEVVENKSTLTERYNLFPTEDFYQQSEADQMEYGSFPCGTGVYYVFDTFIVKVPFTGDAGIVGVTDVKIK